MNAKGYGHQGVLVTLCFQAYLFAALNARNTKKNKTRKLNNEHGTLPLMTFSVRSGAVCTSHKY